MRRVAVGRVTPRDELVEACREHLCWVEFDHCAFYRVLPGRRHWDDGTTVDRLRSVLCLRGSRLRQFADPTAGRLSQAVWQDIGGYRCLCAAAFDRLAGWPAPASWSGVPGTSGLATRRGRLRAHGSTPVGAETISTTASAVCDFSDIDPVSRLRLTFLDRVRNRVPGRGGGPPAVVDVSSGSG